jgi:hypothetical protein
MALFCHSEQSEESVNMSKDKEILDNITDKEYEHGFVTSVHSLRRFVSIRTWFADISLQ